MKRIYLVNLCLLTALAGHQTAIAKKAEAEVEKFSRAEYMVMNLNKGPKSAGSFISLALKETRETVKSLDRAVRQVEQVDREYAKSKGRPDDRYLAGSAEQLKSALKAAQKLEEELVSARDELKSGIQQSLVRD